jgi:hypothetical protein
MTMRFGERNSVAMEFMGHVVQLYGPRNDAFNESYKMFFQFDKLKEEGVPSIATSDVRSVGQMSIHLMSRHPHRDKLPNSVYDAAQQSKRSKAERAVKGWHRENDFGKRGYLQQGRSWQQHELASWLTFTGWAVQYTALLPGPNQEPMPVAHLMDPSSSYPIWAGPNGEMSMFGYTYQTSGSRLRSLAMTGDYIMPDHLDDYETYSVLDFWELRQNKQNPSQPDVLNTVFFGSGHGRNGNTGWTLLREEKNFSPGTNDTNTMDGFIEIPIKVIKPGDIPIAGSFQSALSEVYKLTGGGILGPMKKEWESVNELVTTLRVDIQNALRDSTYTQVNSPGAMEVLEAEELWTIKSLDNDTSVSHPLRRDPMVPGLMGQVEYIQGKLDKLTLTGEVFGILNRTLSGVALKSAQEAARAPIEPYKTGMEYLYEATGKIWLEDYMRRWKNSSKGDIRISGTDTRLGFFDEDFSMDDIPDSTAFKSFVDLALPEDSMMQANIFRTYNPEAKLSIEYLRENVANIEDTGLEAERLAADNVEKSETFINTEVAQKLFELAAKAEQEGDTNKATIYVIGAQQLMQNLNPQQGQGIPERPGLGRPEAGGAIPNAGGSNPALSNENRVVEPGQVARPAPGGR